MIKVQIKEHREPCITVNLVDIDNNYVIAYNVRRDYAEFIMACIERAETSMARDAAPVTSEEKSESS